MLLFFENCLRYFVTGSLLHESLLPIFFCYLTMFINVLKIMRSILSSSWFRLIRYSFMLKFIFINFSTGWFFVYNLTKYNPSMILLIFIQPLNILIIILIFWTELPSASYTYTTSGWYLLEMEILRCGCRFSELHFVRSWKQT